MRTLLIQYEGDFLEAYERLEQTGSEIYYGHKYILEQLDRIGQQLGETAILCCRSRTAYDVVLPTGLRVMGGGADKEWDGAAILDRVKAYDPTHIVVLGPLTKFIKWGLRSGKAVSCIFADSFEISRLRLLYRYGRLGRLLNDPRVLWVANHGVGASQSLARLGVNENKIIPWDWTYSRQPDDLPVRSAPLGKKVTLFFAGSITERKGIPDILNAVALLKRDGVNADVKLAGDGEIERFSKHAEDLGVSDQVEFLGRIANSAVAEQMRAATIVVVPSQHAYPEGLPLTIYEALCARTPLVVSDHPMFVGRLADEQTALIYPSGDAESLAEKIRRLIEDEQLYARLSENSQKAWLSLQISAKWGEVLLRMLRDGKGDKTWLSSHSLHSAVHSSRSTQ